MEYKVVFIETADRDLVGIEEYIISHFNAPMAAQRLVSKIARECYALSTNPRGAHLAIHPRLRRKSIYQLNVKNYTVLLRINKTSHIITILRVIYSGRDFGHLRLD